MKRLFILLTCVLLALSSIGQVPSDTAGLRAKINTWLVPNGTNQITAQKMNQLFNGVANLMKAYAVDSAYFGHDTLFLLRKGGFSPIVLKLPGSGAAEYDPTVSQAVKAITEVDITSWNAKQNRLFLTSGLYFEGGFLKVRKDSAIWNANALNGNPVSNTAPADGQALIWRSTEYVPETPSGGGDDFLKRTLIADDTMNTGTHSFRMAGSTGTFLSTKEVPGTSYTRLTQNSSGIALTYRDLTTGNFKAVTVGDGASGIVFQDQVNQLGPVGSGDYTANAKTSPLAYLQTKGIKDLVSDSIRAHPGGGDPVDTLHLRDDITVLQVTKLDAGDTLHLREDVNALQSNKLGAASNGAHKDGDVLKLGGLLTDGTTVIGGGGTYDKTMRFDALDSFFVDGLDATFNAPIINFYGGATDGGKITFSNKHGHLYLQNYKVELYAHDTLLLDGQVYKIKALASTSDTAFKPMVIDGDGYAKQLDRWPIGLSPWQLDGSNNLVPKSFAGSRLELNKNVKILDSGILITTAIGNTGQRSKDPGAISRMEYIPGKGALRVGNYLGHPIYPDTIGPGSVAFGELSTAPGKGAFAAGSSITFKAGAVGMGASTIDGDYGFGMGFNVQNKGDYGAVFGEYTISTKKNQFTLGRNNDTTFGGNIFQIGFGITGTIDHPENATKRNLFAVDSSGLIRLDTGYYKTGGVVKMMTMNNGIVGYQDIPAGTSPADVADSLAAFKERLDADSADLFLDRHPHQDSIVPISSAAVWDALDSLHTLIGDGPGSGDLDDVLTNGNISGQDAYLGGLYVRNETPVTDLGGWKLETGTGGATATAQTYNGSSYVDGAASIKGSSVSLNDELTATSSSTSLNSMAGTDDRIALVDENGTFKPGIHKDSLALLANTEAITVLTFTTTNATPVNIDTISLANGESVVIEATVNAQLSTGAASYIAKKVNSLFKNNSGSVSAGTVTDLKANAYPGTGLSTATLDITTISTAYGILKATGESGKTINWKVTYTK